MSSKPPAITAERLINLAHPRSKSEVETACLDESRSTSPNRADRKSNFKFRPPRSSVITSLEKTRYKQSQLIVCSSSHSSRQFQQHIRLPSSTTWADPPQTPRQTKNVFWHAVRLGRKPAKPATTTPTPHPNPRFQQQTPMPSSREARRGHLACRRACFLRGRMLPESSAVPTAIPSRPQRFGLDIRCNSTWAKRSSFCAMNSKTDNRRRTRRQPQLCRSIPKTRNDHR